MASGHDVNKPRTEFSHQTRRDVSRERFQMGEGFGGVNAEYEAMQDYDDNEGLDQEMRTRSRLEDEYGGGAGDWDY